VRDLKGAIVGRHLVRISTYRAPDEGAEDPVPLAPEKVPDKYHRDSQEIREVTAGDNIINFNIKSTDGPITQPDLTLDEEL
jgi:hypothetical protein